MSEMTREEAKELFEDNFTVINTHGHYTKEEEGQAQELAISALFENKGEWIPVSKRLPEVGSAVYGQLVDGSHEILFMDNFDGQMTWRGRWRSHYNVIAWREMPEPYKGE